MNVTFSWVRDASGYSPTSTSDEQNDDGYSLVDCILMDNGGLTDSEVIPWLDEGILRIKSVLAGEVESSDWSRETWGAKLNNNKAIIHSLHDENYDQVIDLQGFLTVLTKWRSFIQFKPTDTSFNALRTSITI